MLCYIMKRLALAALTIFVIMLVSYMLLRLAPGDPTKSSVFGEGGGEGLAAEKGAFAQNKALREKLHLDKPVLTGFALWGKDLLLKRDLGESASVDKGRPVFAIIMERLPVTLSLNIWAVLVTYLLAIPTGIFASVRPDSKFDRVSTFVLFFLYSLPVFWVALVLQATVCQGGCWPLFPLKGIDATNTWGVTTWGVFLDSARHYVLPVFCLSYAGFAGLSRFARSNMLDVLGQDYVRTARAKGVSESMVVLKHAFRNALVTLVTLFAGLIPGLVGGSIIVEHVFGIPGMGSLSMTALTSRDIPLLMALFAFGGVLTLLGILLSDLLYVAVDPRISFEGRK